MGSRDAFVDQAHELYAALLREFLTPPLSLACSSWADQFRRITKGPEKGLWRTSRTPYLQEPMDCTDPESSVQKVVMQFATQLGKSEVLYNAVFKRIHIQPMDMMFVQPTLNDAKDHSRERFMPTARAMPEISKRLPKSSSRDETNTWQTKQVQGGATLFFSGANSARSLASKPLPFVACDEIDGYPLDVDGEGDPLGLVWERMSNFPQRKLLLCSTPTIKDVSRVEAEYLASDRRRFWVPCPHCGEFQVLEWGADADHGIKWLRTPTGEARPSTAVYVCKHCAGAIEDRQKSVMLPDGKWRPDAPGAGDGLVAGFHLSKLYSPVGWKSWPMLVTDWVKAREAAKAGDVTKLKTFINTSLAETWEEQGDRVQHHELSKRAEPFQLGTLPRRVLMVVMGVDVQPDRLECRIWGFGRGEESWLIDRHIIYGDPNLDESVPASPWKRLTEIRRTPLQHECGKNLNVEAVAIDTGGANTQAVYHYCRTHAGENVLAMKGASVSGRPVIGRPSSVDVNWRGVQMPKSLKLWMVGTDTAKHLIFGRLRIYQPGSGYVHLPSALNESDEYEQLTAERLVTKYTKGHAKLEWVKPNGKRNEALDCAVYAYAAACYLGIQQAKEAFWKRREDRILPAESAAQEVKPTQAAPEPEPPKPVVNPVQPIYRPRRPAPTRVW